MHNLGTVFNYEVIRALKKKSFWITALAFPLIMGVVFGIVFLSNQATEQAVKNMERQTFSFEIKDDSGLVKPELASALGAREAASREQGIADVKSGKLDAFFYYPKDLSKGIETYGTNVGIFNNGRYGAVAKAMIEQSVQTSVDPNARLILSGGTAIRAETYENGAIHDPIKEMIAPGLFLVLFYFLIAMFGNQALTSTTEEKENRVIEMLLTTVKADTLITGKILSLIIIAFIQGLMFMLPVIIGYIFFREHLALPDVDLSSLPLDPARIGIAALITAASMMFFMGLLVAIGAATPTAKEAGSFLGIVMVFLFGPLYAASLFISNPESPIVQVLSYVPFTSPIPLLLRNAAGTITWPELLGGAALLVVAAVIVIRIAVRTFRYGALEYSRKLTFKEIFGRK